MTSSHHSNRIGGQMMRKGNPSQSALVEIGPTDKALKEWKNLGLSPPDLSRMRTDRLKRLCAELQKNDLGGILLFDPINIRYATDASNMLVWTSREFARAAFVSADGYTILWDFDRCEHLTKHLDLINERRSGASVNHFLTGAKEWERAKKFAQEIAEVVKTHCRPKRLGLDKAELSVVDALESLGVELTRGRPVIDRVRLIKSVDEISAMRCSVAACEAAVEEMRQAFVPGIAEVELWAYLHHGNIARGGEWIEARLLASGPRTNPWMQEAGSRIIRPGELLAFDTDMIGPYGMCCDMSRTWLCGDLAATASQKDLFHVALEHLQQNAALLKPGVEFRDLTFQGHQLPEKFVPLRYSMKMHGVGLCDEYPAIYYPQDYLPGAFVGVVEPGMVFSVEAYVGAVGGSEGVKLEDQVLVTENGPQNLTTYRFDDRLL